VRKLAIGPLVLLLLSACAGDDPPDPGPDAVDVSVRQIYDMSQGTYIEGAYSYIRVEKLDGSEPIEKQFTQEGRKLDELRLLSTITLRIDPGSYRLVSFQRPCNANCANANLGPPTDECSREFVVVRGRPVEATITVRPGEGCSVEVEQQ
jgi:hypothetical protein